MSLIHKIRLINNERIEEYTNGPVLCSYPKSLKKVNIDITEYLISSSYNKRITDKLLQSNNIQPIQCSYSKKNTSELKFYLSSNKNNETNENNENNENESGIKIINEGLKCIIYLPKQNFYEIKAKRYKNFETVILDISTFKKNKNNVCDYRGYMRLENHKSYNIILN
jgi:hypothetical protein